MIKIGRVIEEDSVPLEPIHRRCHPVRRWLEKLWWALIYQLHFPIWCLKLQHNIFSPDDWVDGIKEPPSTHRIGPLIKFIGEYLQRIIKVEVSTSFNYNTTYFTNLSQSPDEGGGGEMMMIWIDDYDDDVVVVVITNFPFFILHSHWHVSPFQSSIHWIVISHNAGEDQNWN